VYDEKKCEGVDADNAAMMQMEKCPAPAPAIIVPRRSRDRHCLLTFGTQNTGIQVLTASASILIIMIETQQRGDDMASHTVNSS